MAKFNGFIASILLCLLVSCGGGSDSTIVPAGELEVLDLTPDEFGYLTLGKTSDMTITLKNVGPGKVTYMESAAITAPFSYTGGGVYPGVGGTCDKVLEVDATCTLVITYTSPDTVSTPSQTITVNYNDGNELVNLEIPINGIADNMTFQPTPAMLAGSGDIVRTITTAADGSGTLYVGGLFTSFSGSTRNELARIYADGTLDTRFNPGTLFNSSVFAVVPLSDGLLYVGGSTAANRLVRLFSDGTKDTTFAVTCSDGTVNAIVPLNDGTGRIYVGGTMGPTGCNGSGALKVARFAADGTWDSTFNPALTAGTVSALALDSNGKLYVAGNFTSPTNRLVRLDSTGAVDAGFAVGTGFPAGAVNALALTADSHIYAAGTFTTYQGAAANSYNRIIRLSTATGSPDVGFVLSVGGGFNTTVNALSIAPNGTSVDVGGNFTTYEGSTYGAFVRLLATGAVDTTVDLSGGGFGTNVTSLMSARDGSNELYVGGNYTTYKGTAALNLVRIRANGTRE